MEGIFKEGHPLLPKIPDLSYYNWTTQKVNSTDSTFFRVDAGPKERLSFNRFVKEVNKIILKKLSIIKIN